MRQLTASPVDVLDEAYFSTVFSEALDPTETEASEKVHEAACAAPARASSVEAAEKRIVLVLGVVVQLGDS